MTVDLNGILIHAKSIFAHFFNFFHTTEMEVLKILIFFRYAGSVNQVIKKVWLKMKIACSWVFIMHAHEAPNLHLVFQQNCECKAII